LLYFLTQQWEKYETLDFDYQLLQTAYQLADESLRQQIGEIARKAGRVELVQVLTGGRKGKRLSSMSEADWDTTLAILRSRQEWEQMWLLAQKAPAIFSRRFLQQFQQVNWQPKEEEGEEFRQLVKLSGQCREEGLYRETLDILTKATYSVECLAKVQDGTLLSSGSDDNTVRLFSLSYLPIDAINLKQIDWIKSPLTAGTCLQEQSNWLQFILALVRWNRRFDIEVVEEPRVIEVGEFDIDIEIEG
jgi:WD40 repeat protein